jgi:dienelactone hydrolase
MRRPAERLALAGYLTLVVDLFGTGRLRCVMATEVSITEPLAGRAVPPGRRPALCAGTALIWQSEDRVLVNGLTTIVF